MKFKQWQKEKYDDLMTIPSEFQPWKYVIPWDKPLDMERLILEHRSSVDCRAISQSLQKTYHELSAEKIERAKLAFKCYMEELAEKQKEVSYTIIPPKKPLPLPKYPVQ